MGIRAKDIDDFDTNPEDAETSEKGDDFGEVEAILGLNQASPTHD